nr:uncharacterized protein LOC109178468 [Ipomoea trifida]
MMLLIASAKEIEQVKSSDRPSKLLSQLCKQGEEAQATGPSDVPAATAPKFARLEFPRFDGREDPSAWLHRSEQFFKAQNTPAREFVSLAAFHLTGVAQTWHLRLELEDPAISWQHFNQRCYLRFGPGLRGNALGMLTNVCQNGRPMEEYTDEFQEILDLTTTVRQDQEVDLYTAGLDEWLRIDVENLHPLNLDVAMNIARSSSRKQLWFSHPYAADPSFFPVPFAGGSHQSHQSVSHQPHQSAAHVPRPGQTRSPATSFVSSTGSRPVAGPRPATSVTRSGSAVSSGNHPPERRLPRSEHLFLLVIDDAAPPSADEDFFVPDQLDQTDLERPEISLHAITGTRNGNTMRVNLLLNNRPITALIDSGSTHNFVDSATAKRLGLIIRSCPFLQVAVANGERVTGLGICEDIQLQKDSNYFPVNLFVIPLVGFEIVLGVHWLRTLGAILWDFTALTMTFTYVGRPEPTALPPKRQCDHRITLVTGADPVAVRPYRYPQAQKDEIERQSPVSPFLDSLRGDLAASDTARTLMGKIQNGSEGPNWTLDDGLIRYKGEVPKHPFPPHIARDAFSRPRARNIGGNCQKK